MSDRDRMERDIFQALSETQYAFNRAIARAQDAGFSTRVANWRGFAQPHGTYPNGAEFELAPVSRTTTRNPPPDNVA